MADYKDATGLLLALRSEIPYDWFSFACDLALSTTSEAVSPADSEKLVSLFFQRDKYTPQTTISAPTTTTTTTLTPSVCRPLRELSSFINFKRLSKVLHVKLPRRITLVFGTNGSGKSSVCEAIKLLATPSVPDGPLNNVYGSLSSSPAFSYRFEPDTSPATWDKSLGYGNFSSNIKFFDSTIAVNRLTDDLHPETIVEIAPFRLEVFEYCRHFVDHLREHINTILADIGRKIESSITVIDAYFADITDDQKTAIASLSTGDFTELERQLTDFTPLSSDDVRAFEEAQRDLARLTDALTPQGERQLRTEISALRRLQSSLSQILEVWQKNSPDEFVNTVRQLLSNKSALASLAADILPQGVVFERFSLFLKSARGVFTFPGSEGDPCPFCRRPLDVAACELITKYHAFLRNTLQDEINALTLRIEVSAEKLESIRSFEFGIEQDVLGIFSVEDRQELLDCIARMRSSIPNPLPRDDVPAFGMCDLVPLQRWMNRLGQEAQRREELLITLSSGGGAQEHENDRLRKLIHHYTYNQKTGDKREELEDVCRDCKSRQAIQNLVKLTDFPTILRRMTNAGKQAHNDLVVAQFEESLDGEYRALSGKGLDDFGIRLKPRGQQQEVAVGTHIRDTPIQRVLSEGEQKIHSLAMFFCEAMARPCDIFVFDDPSTSFDYNHLASFVERLRNLARQFPCSQFIIFTHNWDLFVQVQNVFNKAHLNSDMDVMVMENCSLVEAYSEKIEDLKRQIDAFMVQPGDLTSSQKEQVSGLLRRLIESVVNRYVFNGQRHQFKQRSQSVSVFEEYVRLVPLTAQEAQKLSDLYAHLSVSEHDDPRNMYVSRNKTSFQRWYNDICGIESDLLSRKP